MSPMHRVVGSRTNSFSRFDPYDSSEPSWRGSKVQRSPSRSSTIKSAVEGNIKRPLVIEEVAQVKALIPRAITFTYVDENMLQVTMMGEGDGIRAGYADNLRSLEEDGNRPGKADNCAPRELLL